MREFEGDFVFYGHESEKNVAREMMNGRQFLVLANKFKEGKTSGTKDRPNAFCVAKFEQGLESFKLETALDNLVGLEDCSIYKLDGGVCTEQISPASNAEKAEILSGFIEFGISAGKGNGSTQSKSDITILMFKFLNSAFESREEMAEAIKSIRSVAPEIKQYIPTTKGLDEREMGALYYTALEESSLSELEKVHGKLVERLNEVNAGK